MILPTESPRTYRIEPIAAADRGFVGIVGVDWDYSKHSEHLVVSTERVDPATTADIEIPNQMRVIVELEH